MTSLDCLPGPYRRQTAKRLGALLVGMAVALTAAYTARGQQNPTPQPTTSKAGPTSTPPTPPSPNEPQQPATVPPAPAGTPSPSQTPHSPAPAQNTSPLTLDEALRLANIQASGFQQAQLNERIAAEDVRQAQAAFLPRLSVASNYIYTSPLVGAAHGTPQEPSFIAADAVNVYDGFLNLSGDLDISGRLRATLARSRALLAAAHAGTEVARRALAQSVVEAYYGLGLAVAQSRAAEQNLLAAGEFERITSLLLSGGEVAPVDLTRAELQTISRRDELERARANETITASALRILVGYDFLRPIVTTDLTVALPVDDEVSRLTADMISSRPEFAEFEAERQAAEQEIRIARTERRPQLSYSINGGFDTDSLRPPHLKEHSGASAAFSLSFPIFDWGASKSREQQARLRAQVAESLRQQAMRGFAEQFYASRAQAVSAANRIRVMATGITQAENNLSASIARYRAGEAQIIEVTDAQTTLVSQRQALYQAIFDYQVALARLKQASGQ